MQMQDIVQKSLKYYQNIVQILSIKVQNIIKILLTGCFAETLSKHYKNLKKYQNIINLLSNYTMTGCSAEKIENRVWKR